MSPGEIRVLAFLKRNQNRTIKESEIKIDGMNTREISSSVSWLEAKGYLTTTRETSSTWKLGPEGVKYLESLLKNSPSDLQRRMKCDKDI